jgi:PqqD family protein of HPr-rel-A system
MWRVIPGQLLDYRSWDDDEFVLYNNLSGDTHLLGAAAIAILLTLKQAPATPEALAQSLRAAFEPDTQAELEQQVSGLLADLKRLHLVELPAC